MEGETQAITAELLRFDDDPAVLRRRPTAISGPADGTLFKRVALTSFTQDDIDNGRVTYQRRGKRASDGFSFTVTDAAGNTTGRNSSVS